MDKDWITEEIEQEYKDDQQSKQKFILPVVVGVLIIAIIGAFLVYFYVNADDISSYADEEILIHGLTEEDFTITPAELLTLSCVEIYTSGRSTKSEGTNGVGPELETFLAEYGKTKTDFTKVKFVCSDDYTIVLKDKYLKGDYQIVLVVKQLMKKLPKTQQPLRIIIPEAESAKWAYGVLEIDFIK